MKKLLVFAATALLLVASASAQNKFRGSVIYKATSVGEKAFKIPDEMATIAVKVFDDKVITSAALMTGSPMVNCMIVDGHKSMSCWDFSMLMTAFTQYEIELEYSGPSKVFLKNEISQKDIDSLTIPCTEGMYIEYVDGEKRTIAGVEAKKAVLHVFDAEGVERKNVVWYSDEMGPDVNLLFNGIRGMALEYTMNIGDGVEILVSATEIKKGKVKEVDMLIPEGFVEIPVDDFKDLMQEISDALSEMQE